MKRTVTHTRGKISKGQDIDEYDGTNINFSEFASPKQAFEKMAETTRHLDTHSIKTTLTLDANNMLETTLIETEIPAQSQTSRSQPQFFQPSTRNIPSATPKASQSSSSSNRRGNSRAVSEIHFNSSCRPNIQSSIGKVNIPPGIVLTPEMEKLVELHQNKMSKNVTRRVVITNPTDAELIKDVKSLIDKKLSNDRYNTDIDVIELSEEIQQILTSYESVQRLTDTDRAALIYKQNALKVICDDIDNSTPSPRASAY